MRPRPSARGRKDVKALETTGPDQGLYVALTRRGVSRRTFLRFSAAMAAALALPATYAPRIARAVTDAPRLPVVWLRGQDCAGDTMAFLRSTGATYLEKPFSIRSVAT